MAMWNVGRTLIIATILVLAAGGCGRNLSSHVHGVLPSGSDLGDMQTAGSNLNPQSADPSAPNNNQDPVQHITLEPVTTQAPFGGTSKVAPLAVHITDFSPNKNTKSVSISASFDGEPSLVLEGALEQGQAHLTSADKNVEAFAICKTDE